MWLVFNVLCYYIVRLTNDLAARLMLARRTV